MLPPPVRLYYLWKVAVFCNCRKSRDICLRRQARAIVSRMKILEGNTLMNTAKLICAIAVTAAISGCAGTYKAPITKPVVVSRATNISQDAIIKASKSALISDGYQISSYDDKTGFVSTAPRDLHLSPAQADCGKTMGLDYLKDKRTKTRVSYGVLYETGLVTVKANIEGEYKPGSVSQDITLTCVSHGTLENELLDKVISTASRY